MERRGGRGGPARSRRSLHLRPYEESQLEPLDVDLLSAVEVLSGEVARLRKTLLKLGHAQELFQGRVEEQVGRLSRSLERSAAGTGEPGAVPNPAQLRTLMELDGAVLHLLAFVQDGQSPRSQQAVSVRPDAPDPEASPRSVREGLSLLRVRVRNLQRSFGLEPVPSRGRSFDDRCHQAYGVCHRPDLEDGEVAEEILPGYRLGERVVRPALVIVNRRKE